MTFKDIKGHDKTIALLMTYLREQRLSSSFLFVGAQGLGKFFTAKIVAQAVNCLTHNGDACGGCPSCLAIAKNQHPDVHIIDPAAVAQEAGEDSLDQAQSARSSGVIKIDHIRSLQRQVNLKPYQGQKKVFIINDADRMTAEAANCLLKTLEEPPENSLIILVTAKPSLLFKTVISRCRLIKFYPLQRQSLADMLVNDYGLTQGPGRFLAFFSEGRMGSAIALKDSEIFQKKNEIIDAFFVSPPARGSRLLGTDRVSLRHHLNILATWFRDIYLCKAQVPDSEFIHCDRIPDVVRAAAGYSFAALDTIVQSISEALLHIDQNINPRLVVANLRVVLS